MERANSFKLCHQDRSGQYIQRELSSSMWGLWCGVWHGDVLQRNISRKPLWVEVSEEPRKYLGIVRECWRKQKQCLWKTKAHGQKCRVTSWSVSLCLRVGGGMGRFRISLWKRSYALQRVGWLSRNSGQSCVWKDNTGSCIAMYLRECY